MGAGGNTAGVEAASEGMGLFERGRGGGPTGLLGGVAGDMTKAEMVQGGDVRGFREELSIEGAGIERIYGFGPHPDCATMITLVTHRDICCIAANVDCAAITDTELFGQCLEEGFAEVLALHEGSERPRRRINGAMPPDGA